MGLFIVFEGIDGAGKTTQVGLLRDALSKAGACVVVSKEPTDGKWGTILRQSATSGRLSPEQELDTFIKDRTEHVDTLVRPSLHAGKTVILDRYFYSTIAYQGSRGAEPDQVREQMESIFPIPDAVFIIDIAPKAGVHRIAHSRGETPNEFETRSGLEKARQIFRSIYGRNIFHIEGSRSPEEIHLEILSHIRANWKGFVP